jgi:hypothetical protein
MATAVPVIPEPRRFSIRLSRPISLAALGIALIAGWVSAPGRADDGNRELPKDGAWARYDENWERLDNGQKVSYSATLSFVGKLVEKDELCRWVEMKYVALDGPEKDTLIISKMLIREKDLHESENPITCVLRCWEQVNDEPARLSDAHQNYASTIGPLLLWTPGALKNAAAAGKPKDIEYQQGRLKAAKAWTGKMKIAERNQAGHVVIQRLRQFTSWQHADLPVGFAEAEIKDDVYNADMTRLYSRSVSVLLLQDAGTDATSALPDCN